MDTTWKDPYRGNYNSDQYVGRRGDVRLSKTDGTANGTRGAPIYPEKVNIVTDEKYYEELYTLYANVLNAKGYNIDDTFEASMNYFNKTQMKIADPVTNGKTYIFITRPDLNFWQVNAGIRNVEYVDLFRYMSRLNIGLATMPWLMFPNGMPLEFTNEPGAKVAYRSNVGSQKIWCGENSGNYSVRSNGFTPFIPILSNCCTSCTGAKDLSLETKTTEGDYHGNKLQYSKGADESFEPGEISLEFDDIYGSPVLHMINMWVNYIHYLLKGICVTWGQYVKYRIIDYTCSVYIFMTEKDGKTISRWAKWTGCFPKSVPLSNIQHNITVQPDALRSISVPFAYNRYEPMKPNTLVDFNYMMNKFIFSDLVNDQVGFITNRQFHNREWMLRTGVAPKKLIRPPSPTVDMIRNNPNWRGPRYVLGEGDDGIKYMDESYYDNKYWGTIPYIVDHQLVWLDPNKIDWQSVDGLYSASHNSKVGLYNDLNPDVAATMKKVIDAGTKYSYGG